VGALFRSRFVAQAILLLCLPIAGRVWLYWVALPAVSREVGWAAAALGTATPPGKGEEYLR